jgi:hypothetical protein
VSDSKLTFTDIENMSNEERANLKDKDYKHLGSIERQKVKILIKTARKPSAQGELMGSKNTSENGSENAIDNGNVYVNERSDDIDELAQRIKNAKAKKKKKPKFEETHTKDTLWIKNDIYKAVNEICTERGDKTRFINEALYQYILQKSNESK